MWFFDKSTCWNWIFNYSQSFTFVLKSIKILQNFRTINKLNQCTKWQKKNCSMVKIVTETTFVLLLTQVFVPLLTTSCLFIFSFSPSFKPNVLNFKVSALKWKFSLVLKLNFNGNNETSILLSHERMVWHCLII